MKTGAALVGMAIVGAVGFAVGYSVNKGSTVSVREATKTPPSPAGAPTPSPAAAVAEAATDVFKVPVGTSPVRGNPDALVTIVEISDFECPFCSKVVPTLDQIKQEYGDKVRFVFKHNPLPFHQKAVPAHEWSIAAAQQGKFWEYHDKVFANQSDLSPQALERYASEVGVDVTKAKSFVDSGGAKSVISADQALAAKIGARGTPAFFINGVSISGAQPIDNFKKIVDAQITKATGLLQSGTPKAQLYETIIASGRESAPPPQQPQAAPPATRQKVALVSGTPSKGSKSPLVTIVEWSDFECPFCSKVVPTLEQIHTTYGDKVQVQFRHQPLPFHQRAMPAAKAAAAAQKQGKFWEMHDKMFQNQRALGDEDLERYAKEIGLNIGKWKADMESPEIQAAIQKDMNDGTTYGARGTPTLFVNGVPVKGAMPFDSFKTVIDKEIELAEKIIKEGTPRKDVYDVVMEREAGKVVADAAPRQVAAPPAAPAGPVDVKFGRAPVKGKPTAPIQLVVYSDFECPFCGKVNPTIEKVRETYGDKVAVAFKHYPLPFHNNAEGAAVASLAAHRQGKFWEMHDKLFQNQRALARDSLVGYARELGLNVDKFQKDIDDPELKKWVQDDMAEGSKFGVNGTPATFVNGRLLSGAVPFENFQSLIDAELKKRS